MGRISWVSSNGKISDNVNTEELGNLGLKIWEEVAIVAFLKTLSDDFEPESKDKHKHKK